MINIDIDWDAITFIAFFLIVLGGPGIYYAIESYSKANVQIEMAKAGLEQKVVMATNTNGHVEKEIIWVKPISVTTPAIPQLEAK